MFGDGTYGGDQLYGGTMDVASAAPYAFGTQWAGKRFRLLNLVPRPTDSGNAANFPALTPAYFYDLMYDIGTNGATDVGWTKWLKPQIDAAHSIGVTAVKMVLDASVMGDATHHGPATWRGALTAAQLRSFLALVINYTASLGMWFYPAGAEPNTIDPLTPAQVTTYVSTLIGIVSDPIYSNVIGIDLMTEFDRSTYCITPGVLNSIMATARAASLKTFAIGNAITALTAWTQYVPMAVAAQPDYLDLHMYLDSEPLLLTLLAPNYTHLPIVVGETGIGFNGYYFDESQAVQETVHPYSSERRARHFQNMVAGIGTRYDAQLIGPWGVATEWPTVGQDWGLFNLRIPITSIAVGASSVVTTSVPHGRTTGDVVVFAGTNSTPVIDGQRIVTVLNSTQFTVPVTVTVSGSTGLAAQSTVTSITDARTEMTGPLQTTVLNSPAYNATTTLDLTGTDTLASDYAVGTSYAIGWAWLTMGGSFSRVSHRIKRTNGAIGVGAVNYFALPSIDQAISVDFDASLAVPSGGEIVWAVSVRHQGDTIVNLVPTKYYVGNFNYQPGNVADGQLSIYRVDSGVFTLVASSIAVTPVSNTHSYRLAFSATGTYPTALSLTLTDTTLSTTYTALTGTDTGVNLQAAGSVGLPTQIGEVHYTNIQTTSTADRGPSVAAPTLGTVTLTTIPISWTAAGGASPYLYIPQYAALDSNGMPGTWISRPLTGSTSDTITSVTPFTTNYAIRIRAFDSAVVPQDRYSAWTLLTLATWTAPGTSTATWTGASAARSAFSAAGSSAAAWVGAGPALSVWTAAGSSAAAFVGSAGTTHTGAATMAGTGTASWVGGTVTPSSIATRRVGFWRTGTRSGGGTL